MTVPPTRVVRLGEARARYGALTDALLPWLWVEDAPADAAAAVLRRDGWQGLGAALSGSDAVPPELRDLVDEVGSLPAWVDEARVRRAGRLFFRTGPIGGLVLGARSLVSGYCSPGGNKALTMTGALQRDANHRLAETGRFVAEVHREGGMRPGAEGWRISARVRIMHAQVRHLLHASGRWRAEDWGAPLNQHDLIATSLLFSVVWVDGVRRMGLRVTREEAEDHLHLWRWISVVLGVQPTLPEDEDTARAMASLITLTQGTPDADARALVDALLGSGPGPTVGAGLCRALLEPELADGLALPRTRWRYLAEVARVVNAPLEVARWLHPAAERGLVAAGEHYWEAAIRAGLGARGAQFAGPEALRG